MKLHRLLLLVIVTGLFACGKKDNPTPNNGNNNPPGNNGNDTTQHPDTAKIAASFTYTTDGWVSHFKSTSTHSPTTVKWDFGDGQQGTGDTISHLYANPGDYTVKITAAKTTDSNSVSQVVTLKEQIIEITTSFGVMDMYLYNQTPAYRDNYLKLAKEGFYDSTTFHRIVSNFVIQGGDPLSKDSNPNNDGTGGPGYDIPFSAPSELKHDFGAVGAASTGAKGPSNGSQFYIVVQSGGSHSLDGNYAVFGFIMKGMDIATTIAGQPKNSSDRPLTDIRMSVRILEKTKAEVLSEYGYTIK